MDQLPGFEAIEEPKEDDDEVLPHPTEKEPKIAKFTAEDLTRYLMSKEKQDLLKTTEYHKLPSEYFEEDISTIDNVIDDINSDLVIYGESIILHILHVIQTAMF